MEALLLAAKEDPKLLPSFLLTEGLKEDSEKETSDETSKTAKERGKKPGETTCCDNRKQINYY